MNMNLYVQMCSSKHRDILPDALITWLNLIRLASEVSLTLFTFYSKLCQREASLYFHRKKCPKNFLQSTIFLFLNFSFIAFGQVFYLSWSEGGI